MIHEDGRDTIPFLRMGIDMTAEPRIRLRQEFEQEPRYQLLNSLVTFEGSYGQQNVWEHMSSLEDQIFLNPNIVHVLGLTGEPDSGKSMVQREAIKWLLRGGGAISQLQNWGYQVRIDNLPWGDPFYLVENGLLANEDLSREKLQEVIDNATLKYEEGFEAAITGSYYKKDSFSDADKVIKIVTFDMPIYTGLRRDGETIGMVRGSEMLGDLIHQSGKFEKIKDLYLPPKVIALAASNNVRRAGKAFRSASEVANDSNEVERVAKEHGITFHVINGANLLSYIIENAKVKDVLAIEDQTNETIIALLQSGLMRISQFAKTDGARKTLITELIEIDQKEITVGLLHQFPDDRASLIGRELIPWFGRNELDIPESNIIVLYNGKEMRLDAWVDYEQHYTLREMYPESFKKSAA